MSATITILASPSTSMFPPDEDFIDAPSLEERAMLIIGRESDKFGDLEDQSIAFLWKKTGGSTRGQLKLGMTKRVTGDLKFYSGKSAIIWLAADHHADKTDRQIEATLYHELCHLIVDEEGTLRLLGHDFAGFAAEVEKYGDVLRDAQDIAPAFKQLILFGDESS